MNNIITKKFTTDSFLIEDQKNDKHDIIKFKEEILSNINDK